jgi:site-specific DNA-methyltransferase (adenine-specific)/modification methylase
MTNPTIIGNATLYQGDCRDILPTLGKVDAVVTDPPFGVGNFVQTTGNVRGEAVQWNDETPSADLFRQLRDISVHRIIWGANFFNCFEPNGGALVWVKNQPMPHFSKAEVASCSHLKKTELINLTWTNFVNDKVTQHPCERPVGLYRWCIDYLPYSETILDPFLGSGSCGVAAVQMGRRFIGIEREPKYFDIACKRIEDAQRQGDLFIV